MTVKRRMPAARPAEIIDGLHGQLGSVTPTSSAIPSATSAIVRMPTSTPQPCQPDCGRRTRRCVGDAVLLPVEEQEDEEEHPTPQQQVGRAAHSFQLIH